MPIYEYRCAACNHELEAIQKLSDPELTDCPACEQPALRKRISAVAFRLKGGGWYETDFKKDGKRNLAGDGGGENGKSAGAGEGGEKKTSTTTETPKETKATPSPAPAAADA